MRIKKGDNVVVIAGKDKGKKGKVLETSPKTNKLIVENVNIATKHKKPRSAEDKGGIVKQTNPIQRANVMIICQECGKATRIARKELNGKKVRICKKCGASLDKEFVKAVKKESKKVETKVKDTKKVESKAKDVKKVDTKAKETKNTEIKDKEIKKEIKKEVKTEDKAKEKSVAAKTTTTTKKTTVEKKAAVAKTTTVAKTTKPSTEKKAVKQEKTGSKGQ